MGNDNNLIKIEMSQTNTNTNTIRLTCEETPLAFPKSITLADLNPCSTCGIHLFAPQPGSLQVLTRRQGTGAGDGVNIDEFSGIGADYRGQRYALEEVIFHTPGLHVFPGADAPYAGELHVHMITVSAPQRYITLVIPVSHLVDSDPLTDAYFSSIRSVPDPSAVRPAITSLIKPGTPILQYQGPDVRGRTADTSNCVDATSLKKERQFLLVLRPVHIKATDLERIPREGSLSADPRDLPANPIKPIKTLARDRIQRCTVYANPGILESAQSAQSTTQSASLQEATCKPVKVVNGRDVVESGGKTTDLLTALGAVNASSSASDDSSVSLNTLSVAKGVMMSIGCFIGLLIADWICGFAWTAVFTPAGDRLTQWSLLKVVILLGISTSSAFLVQTE
jgi:hypothetical protein